MGHQIIKKLSFSVLYSISVFSFADSIIVQSTTSTKNSDFTITFCQECRQTPASK